MAFTAPAHELGRVVDNRRPALKDCRGSTFSRIRYPEASRLVAAHFANIYAANHHALKAMSKGPDDFCIVADFWPGSFSANAGAMAESGLILFTPPLLKYLSSEDQLAGVLAHELAHVTVNHDERIPFALRSRVDKKGLDLLNAAFDARERLHAHRQERQAFFTLIKEALQAALRVDPNSARQTRHQAALDRYVSYSAQPWAAHNVNSHPMISDDPLYEQFAQMCREYQIPATATFLEEHESVLRVSKRIGELNRRLRKSFGDMFHPETLTGFREREADEVGLELFVRAGYDPEKYADSVLLFLQMSRPELTTIAAARAFCEEQARAGQVILGEDSHPTLCWRAMNIARELDLHRDDYARLRGTRPTIAPSLAETQLGL